MTHKELPFPQKQKLMKWIELVSIQTGSKTPNRINDHFMQRGMKCNTFDLFHSIRSLLNYGTSQVINDTKALFHRVIQ